jgi:acid stress-induced BolA-like protein IbaG/YrbA
MWSREKIAQTLQENIPGAQVAVDDLTGTSDHFQVTIVAESFEGQTPIERHRSVYSALGSDVGGAIHALSIRAFTPAQWEKISSSTE